MRFNCVECGVEYELTDEALSRNKFRGLCGECGESQRAPYRHNISLINDPSFNGSFTIDSVVSPRGDGPLEFGGPVEISETSFAQGPGSLGNWIVSEARTFRMIMNVPTKTLEGMRAQLLRRKAKIIEQRRQLLDKDAIILQLRERLERAKRGGE